MVDAANLVGWSEAQWETIRNAVNEEVDRTRVAAAVLPKHGPIPDAIDTVRQQRVNSADQQHGAEVTVQDRITEPLRTLRVYVRLTQEQVREDSLSGALAAFRRAANLLAIAEDAAVFYEGSRATAQSPGVRGSTLRPQRVSQILDRVLEDNGEANTGLLEAGWNTAANHAQPQAVIDQGAQSLLQIIGSAVAFLEADFEHAGPVGCVLGTSAYIAAHTPDGSAVLPADQVRDLLVGPLLRSSTMLPDHGVIVSLAGEPVEIVLATAPRVEFLEVSENAEHVFRVYERFKLRIRDPRAVYTFQYAPPYPDPGDVQPAQAQGKVVLKKRPVRNPPKNSRKRK